MLLLSPLLRYVQHREEKPVVLFLQDESSSVKEAFKKTDSIAYRNNVEQLLSKLSGDYEVKSFRIGSALRDSVLFQYNDPSTDLGSALEQVLQSNENLNLGAIILASDGIYNQGPSPLNLPYPYSGTLCTIGLGDTTLQRDALVARTYANRTVYTGDRFAIRTDVAAYACNGQSFTVSVFDHQSGRMIGSQTFRADGERAARQLETVISATGSGLQHYTVRISAAEGERNTANNSSEVYVDVLDSKEKILIVGAAPHPDLFALREALSINRNYAVEVFTASNLKDKAAGYNLIILHNLPSAAFNAQGLIDEARKAGVSLWFIAGGQTALPLLNKVQNALQINGRAAGLNDVQALLNQEFSYFTLPPNGELKALPPLASPFGDYKAGPSAQVLMKQQIGSVRTDFPLWVLQQSSGSRTGVLAGEGLWRWRLYEFNRQKKYDLSDAFILKTVQFLSVKNDPRPFRVFQPKQVYGEHEAVVFDAELYNENRELVNSPEASLELTDSAGKKVRFSMSKESNFYNLNAGPLGAGNYRYSALTVWNGKTYTAGGQFRVIGQALEALQTTADFGLLNGLAEQYGGQFYYPDQISRIADDLKKNPRLKTVLRSQVSTEPLIDWKWLFGLLVLALSAEWWARKRSGGY